MGSFVIRDVKSPSSAKISAMPHPARSAKIGAIDSRFCLLQRSSVYTFAWFDQNLDPETFHAQREDVCRICSVPNNAFNAVRWGAGQEAVRHHHPQRPYH